jgi:hypothetical protein
MFTLTRGSDNVVLPNPLTSTSEALVVQATYKRAMDGSIMGYKKSSERKLYTWSFDNVDKNVTKSLLTFMKTYRDDTIIITSEDYPNLNCVFRSDSITFTNDAESNSGSWYSFQLSMEG